MHHQPVSAIERVKTSPKCPGTSTRRRTHTRFQDGQYTSDRVCADLTVCGTDEFESVRLRYTKGQFTTNRTCQSRRQCSVDEYESAVPEANEDRACLALKVCNDSSNLGTWADQRLTKT